MEFSRVARSFTCGLLALAGAAAHAEAQGAPLRLAGYAQTPRLQPVADRAVPLATRRAAERTVTLRLQAVPLEAALHEVARQADVRLTYSRESLEPGLRVSAHAVAVPADEAFALVLAGTGLEALRSASGRVTIARLAPPPAAPRGARAAAAPARLPATAPGGLLAGPAPLRLQSVGTVRGEVVEAGSRRPLSGAQVTVAGARASAVTDAAGRYALVGVPTGAQRVQASLIGFGGAAQSVQVVAGQAAEAHFALAAEAVALDALVVTGTAGAVSRRSIGNAVTTVNAAELNEKLAVSSVQELLQAQAPGVTILSSSGTPGAAGTIQIRGQSSLSAGLQPVVYIDGVRVHSGAAGSFRNDWRQSAAPGQRMAGAAGAAYGSGQEASALSMINPEDIESIEVIKGPAAATLYGADAANGVIQIITKKGRQGAQRLQWEARLEEGRTEWALDRGTNFTRCTPERVAARTAAGDPVFVGCQGAAGALLSATPLGLPGVLRRGDIRNLSLAVRGGGEQYSFYANVGRDAEQGVEMNSATERTSARANFSFNPMPELDFAVNFNYVRDETQFPQGNNAGNLIESAWSFVPGARGLGRGQLTEDYLAETEAFSVYENWLRGDRLVFGTTLNYRPASWLTNRLTVGGDIGTRESERWITPGSRWGPVEGQLTQGSPKNTVYTLDYAGTVQSQLSAALSSALSFGAQYVNSEFENTAAQGTGFVSGATRAIRFATNNNGWTEFDEVKTLGFYLQEQVGWNDRLFLTGAVRVDNSSVFGENIERIVYPKLSASYVLSEEPFFGRAGWLDQLRLRAAWGEAGNAPGPFAAVRTFSFVETTDPLTGEKSLALVRNTRGNPDVKPERGSEVELGLDASFLGDRLGLEATWYDKTTRDALIPVPIPPSEGYAVNTYLANIGEIANRGVEVAVRATPVRSRLLTWDARLGWSTNHNELVDFGQENPAVPFGLTANVQRNVEGYPLAGYWVRDPVLKAGGDPANPGDYEGSELRYLGPALPTRSGSLANTFTLWGSLSLYALLDYKGGNYLYNHTLQRRCALGVCREVNDAATTPEQRARLVAEIQANTALYTERADFVKLRDVSLTYTLPERFTRRFGTERAALTLAGHNLAFLYKPYSGLDPETNFVGINDPGAEWAGVRADYWNQPMFRRITAAVQLSF
ncbi:MAG TPA: TonB-dependent receptor [Longimicrobiaceae bacterium]|jgi:TonB-dependent SusC/RagA subfamily outer membrane receptor